MRLLRILHRRLQHNVCLASHWLSRVRHAADALAGLLDPLVLATASEVAPHKPWRQMEPLEPRVLLSAPVNFVQIIDNGDPGFSVVGDWKAKQNNGYEGDFLTAKAGDGAAQATWQFTGLTPGMYSVAATWEAKGNQASNAGYHLVDVDDDGLDLGTNTVNQRSNPAGLLDAGGTWQTLGGDVLVVGTTLRVILSNAADKDVYADGIRIERVGDVPAALVTIVATAPVMSEDGEQASFLVTRTGRMGVALDVQYVPSGSADQGEYQVVGGSLGSIELPAFGSSASAVVTVAAVEDNYYQGTEDLTFTLLPGAGAADALRPESNYVVAPPASATVTRLDNESEPTISIFEISVAEGDSGEADAVFKVALSGLTKYPVTVDFATSDGTAQVEDGTPAPGTPGTPGTPGAGGDYAAASGTVTIAPFGTGFTIDVPVFGDNTYEWDEAFTVSLSNAVNVAGIAQATAMGTIVNDDPLPAISISDAAGNEGDPGDLSSAEFTVALSNPSAFPVSVTYATADGSALAADNDYAPGSGTITFAPFQTSQTIAVPVLADDIYEYDQTFTITLATPVGGVLVDETATGLIANDDALPTLTAADITVDETAGSATFTLVLSNRSDLPAQVDFATADAAAAAGWDYNAATGSVTFAARDLLQTVVVPLIDDNIFEGSESFNLLLSASGRGLAGLERSAATATITDDDPIPTVRISSAAVDEGGPGASSTATLTVSLSNRSAFPISVSYSTLDGTAITGGGFAEDDYLPATGSVLFDPLDLEQTAILTVSGDDIYEPDEVFNVLLSGASGAVLDSIGSTGTVGINNDDPLPTVSVDDVTISEDDPAGIATFTIRLSNASTLPVSFDYATVPGSAQEGSDYVPMSGSFTFEPGVREAFGDVAIVADTAFESAESFALQLSSITGAANTAASGTATIENDDSEDSVALFVDQADYAIEGQETSILLTVTGGATIAGFSVDWGDASPVETLPFDTTLAGHRYPEGPAFFLVSVSVTTVDGTTVTADPLPLYVENADPTAELVSAGPADEGSPATVFFQGMADSPEDLAAGLTYSFDFDGDGIFEIADSSVQLAKTMTQKEG